MKWITAVNGQNEVKNEDASIASFLFWLFTIHTK